MEALLPTTFGVAASFFIGFPQSVEEDDICTSAETGALGGGVGVFPSTTGLPGTTGPDVVLASGEVDFVSVGTIESLGLAGGDERVVCGTGVGAFGVALGFSLSVPVSASIAAAFAFCMSSALMVVFSPVITWSAGSDCVGFNCVGLGSTDFGCTGLDCVGLHCGGLECTGLGCTGFDCGGLGCLVLSCTGLDCGVLDCGDLDCTDLDPVATNYPNTVQCSVAQILAGCNKEKIAIGRDMGVLM